MNAQDVVVIEFGYEMIRRLSFGDKLSQTTTSSIF